MAHGPDYLKGMKISKKKKEKKRLGRSDKLDLPELGLLNVDSKIDTGAYSCSIHCSHIEVVEKNGENLLHFILLDPSHPAYNNKSFYFKYFKEKKVKNSFGQAEKRFVIETPVKIYNKIYNTEFSLSNRGNLRFPILLGRKLLKKGFVVDVSKIDLSFKKNKVW